MKTLNRRTFVQALGVAALGGSAVVEAAAQEAVSTGKLSDETAMVLLKHIGYEPNLPDEMKTLKPMLETTLRDLQIIRDFQLPIALEPAFVFHPDK